MGIDIGNKLMLVPTDQGLLRSAIQLVADEEYGGDFYEALYSLDLDYASPWFDADRESLDIGISMPTPTYEDLIDSQSSWFEALHEAQDKLGGMFAGGYVATKLDSFQHVYWGDEDGI
jgi:hypothetical protein